MGCGRALHVSASGLASRPRRRARTDSRPAQPPSGESGNAGGEALYAAACASCHGGERAPPYGGIDLALSSAISAPDARNAANTVLMGIRPREGERGPIMPGFADSMTDAQIAALLAYLRASFSHHQPWTETAEIVRNARDTPADAGKRDRP